MNIKTPWEEGFDEREWQAQERARIALRNGAAPDPLAPADPMAACYRRVAEALRAPTTDLLMSDVLPPDFAAQMARRVQAAGADAGTEADPGFERGLMQALIGLFGLAGAVVAAMYGAQWLPPIFALLRLDSAAAINWALALGACVGASWLVDQVRRRDHGKATRAA